MAEQLKSMFPKYYLDKFEGNDARQVYQLPYGVRRALIYGNKKQFSRILSHIRDEERGEDKVMLGVAAEDLIREMRQMVNDARVTH